MTHEVQNVEAFTKLKCGSWECQVSMPFFSAMSSSSMEVACAWRLHGKKSASRSQSIESRHFASGAREQKEACNNEMSLSNRRKKLMGFLRMDLSP
jgi:hypothetical protein